MEVMAEIQLRSFEKIVHQNYLGDKGGGVMFCVSILGRKIIGLFKVGDGVKVS